MSEHDPGRVRHKHVVETLDKFSEHLNNHRKHLHKKAREHRAARDAQPPVEKEPQ